MHRSHWLLALACLLGAGVGVLRAEVMAPDPVPDRVAAAEIIVVGKVTAIEGKTVMGKRFATDKEKTECTVAVIQVAEPLKGAKGLTTIRLGFVPSVGAGGKPGNYRRFPQLDHKVGQEACFFLKRSPDGDFHVVHRYFDVIDRTALGFDQDVALVKRAAKLLEDPAAGLKARDAEDRLITASMLLTKYRTPRPGEANPRTESIAAEESRLILDAIAGGDWTRPDRQKLSAQEVFQRLRLTPQDGWNPPKFADYQKEFPAYAQRWLKDNANNYRVQRYVP
jgi:hypothetical protein